MRTWTRRALVAHFLSSYFAWTVLAIATVILRASSIKDDWCTLLIIGILAPIVVPFFLAISVNPITTVPVVLPPLAFLPLAAYVAGFLFVQAVFWRSDLRKRRVQERIRRGLCGACGYDLRASPDRCPECGRIPAASAHP